MAWNALAQEGHIIDIRRSGRPSRIRSGRPSRRKRNNSSCATATHVSAWTFSTIRLMLFFDGRYPRYAFPVLAEYIRPNVFPVAPGMTLVIDPDLLGSGADPSPLIERIKTLLEDQLLKDDHDCAAAENDDPLHALIAGRFVAGTKHPIPLAATALTSICTTVWRSFRLPELSETPKRAASKRRSHSRCLSMRYFST